MLAYDKLVPILPNEAVPDNTIPFRMPSVENEQQIINLIDSCNDAIARFGDYTYDLRIEIQNLLLAGIFNRKLERRKPLDPTLKVVSTEAKEYAALTEYFEHETAWGREMQETMTRVRSQHQPQSN